MLGGRQRTLHLIYGCPKPSLLELLSCSKLLRSRKFPNEYDCGNGVPSTRCHSERRKGFYRRLFARRRSFNPANCKHNYLRTSSPRHPRLFSSSPPPPSPPPPPHNPSPTPLL